MKEKHIFNYNVNDVFNTILNSVVADIEEKTGEIKEELKGLKYEYNGMEYFVEECSVDKGYVLTINEDVMSSYTLKITFDKISEESTELLYENIYNSSSKIKVLNHKLTSKLFKRKIRRRYNAFINHVESILKEK